MAVRKGSLEDLGIGDHMDLRKVFEFYKGKKVLVTGHTGFKGAWLCRILINAGAEVTGYSLEPAWREGWIQSSGISGIWTI